MFKFRFPCEDEDSVRYAFENMMCRDIPESGLFGEEYYDAGIHFTQCGERIKGFYINSTERPRSGRRRGRPIRVCFRGRFVERKGKKHFEVYIYPRVWEMLTFLLGFLLVVGGSYAADFSYAGLVFSTLVGGLIAFFYVMNIKATAEFFEKWVR